MFTAPKNNHPLLGSGKVKEVTAILNMCNGDFKAKVIGIVNIGINLFFEKSGMGVK